MVIECKRMNIWLKAHRLLKPPLSLRAFNLTFAELENIQSQASGVLASQITFVQNMHPYIDLTCPSSNLPETKPHLFR